MKKKTKIKITVERTDEEFEVVNYENQHGGVYFKANMLPACCGVTVLYDFSFHFRHTNTNSSEKFYSSLHTWLLSSRRFSLNRAKLLVAAATGSYLDLFCIHNKWENDTQQHNKKSGNDITVYTFNKGVRGNRY